MILLIDNYDSFSYNLVQMAGSIRPDIKVVRNDALTVEEVFGMKPSHIILSPGPGYPKAAGICEELVKKADGTIPILGVCLGHQGICEAFGAEITHARHLMHGKQSHIRIHNETPIFKDLDREEDVARYHSLVAAPESIPDCLEVIAEDAHGEIMAVAHRVYPIFGLQFHPESILTPHGRQMMENFLSL
ncbi:anthranilate synthase component II [Frisingicoccus sp.]|uniref:anthranilate synthase component II n=1 Tax=Frisingicoccus sp. TaxID=1918627 RepID=UPI00399B25EC